MMKSLFLRSILLPSPLVLGAGAPRPPPRPRQAGGRSRPVRGDEVARGRPLPRRPRGHRHRPAGRPQYLLLRRDRRRRLEDDRRRPHLEERLGRLLRRLDRRRRRRRVGPERRLRGRRRGDGARQRLPRRRDVEVDRRRARRWKHIGLADARQIARIRIHPKNPDLVYVAALGHVFGPNEMRGVFRSHGRRRALGARPLRQRREAGAVDLAMDPTNPRILYASTWRFRRTPYSLESGGAGCGALEVDRRRRHLERAVAQPRAAEGDARHHRRRRLAVQSARTSTPSSRRRRAACSARATAARPGRRPATTAICASAPGTTRRDLRRSQGRGRGLRRQRRLPPVEGRRQELRPRSATPHGDNHDLWIDPERPAADDRGERRRRQRHDRRRHDLDDARTTSRRRSSTASRPTPTSPTASSARSRTTRRVRIRHRADGGRHRPARLGADRRRRERLHRRRSEEPRRRLRRLLRRPAHPRYNHAHRRDRDVNPWPDNPMGCGAADIKYRFQWNFPIVFSPQRPEHALRRRRRCCSRAPTAARAGRRSAPT